MPVKLILTWDINPEHEQEYFEFLIREFIPGVQRLGGELSEAWATVYGQQPQIMVGTVLPNAARAYQFLNSPDWEKLHQSLIGLRGKLQSEDRGSPHGISVVSEMEPTRHFSERLFNLVSATCPKASLAGTF